VRYFTGKLRRGVSGVLLSVVGRMMFRLRSTSLEAADVRLLMIVPRSLSER